jgi:hypothetical protein
MLRRSAPECCAACCAASGWFFPHHVDHLLLTLLGEWTRDTQQPQVGFKAYAYSPSSRYAHAQHTHTHTPSGYHHWGLELPPLPRCDLAWGSCLPVL